MDNKKKLDDLIRIADRVKTTPEQEKEQMISFAYGNAKISNPYVTRKMRGRSNGNRP